MQIKASYKGSEEPPKLKLVSNIGEITINNKTFYIIKSDHYSNNWIILLIMRKTSYKYYLKINKCKNEKIP